MPDDTTSPLTRSASLRVRLRQHEKAALVEVAARTGQNLSDVIRSAVLAYVQRILRGRP